MKKALHITATVDQPDLLKTLVEKLAWRRFAPGNIAEQTGKRSFIDTSSTETYISGTIDLSERENEDNNAIHMPFITCFVFTCIKEDDDSYAVEWSNSLS